MPPRRTWPNSSTSPLCTAIVPSRRHRALGDHHDREARHRRRGDAASGAHTPSMSNGCSGTRTTSAPPAMPEYSAIHPGVAAHHLDHHHAVVALRGGVQPVDGVGGDLHRGVEPERDVGGGRGRCRSSSARRPRATPVVAEPRRDAERVLAADGDQRVDALALAACRSDRARRRRRVLNGFVRDVPRIVPPRWISPRVVATRERHRLALDHAAPAVAEPDDLVAVLALALAHDGADHRVEPRAVAPAGQHADAHRPFYPPSTAVAGRHDHGHEGRRHRLLGVSR